MLSKFFKSKLVHFLVSDIDHFSNFICIVILFIFANLNTIVIRLFLFFFERKKFIISASWNFNNIKYFSEMNSSVVHINV